MATPSMAGRSVAAPAAVEVSIVVPTRNEAANVAPLYRALDEALQAAGRQNYEVLFVDGQSADSTADNVRELAAGQGGRVRLMIRESRHSLSAAVIDGFAKSRSDVIVVMDADLQHPPEVVPKLLAAIAEGADIAIASRYTAGGDSELGWFRNIFSRGCTRLVRTALGSGFDISDPLSGFFALRRRVIAGRTLSGTGFKILMEVLACGEYREVREVPFRFVQRQHGKSKLGVGTALRDVGGLLRAAREFRRRKSTAPGAASRVPS